MSDPHPPRRGFHTFDLTRADVEERTAARGNDFLRLRVGPPMVCLYVFDRDVIAYVWKAVKEGNSMTLDVEEKRTHDETYWHAVGYEHPGQMSLL